MVACGLKTARRRKAFKKWFSEETKRLDELEKKAAEKRPEPPESATDDAAKTRATAE